MKKIGIVLCVLCGLIITNAGNVLADPFSWYFGTDPSSPYEVLISGPVDRVYIPATFLANEYLPSGFIVGASGGATIDGEVLSGGAFNFSDYRPTAGEEVFVGTYSFFPYVIFGLPTPGIDLVAEGIYRPVLQWCSLNYWGSESLISVRPLNEFEITVVNQVNSVPEPTTMLLLGLGLVGLAGIRRKFKK